MTDASASPLVGALIDRRFRIESFIGSGEKGALVFRGQDIETGAAAAIRCPGVPPELKGLDYAQALDRFAREAEELKRACETSRDIEQLLAHGIAEPATPGGVVRRLPFCVFEWLEGKSLEQHMIDRAGASQSLGEAIAILEPAARALASAHAVGVAHKDVRPRNLWLAQVDGRMRMKLTQFVLASRIGPDEVFSPRYGAPEHFKRTYGPIGTHTDVYGLALCLVELVSGQRAFAGDDDAELYLATSDLTRRPTLRARGVHVSEAVEAVLARALAVDPKRRWQTAREMWDALLAAVPELTPAAPSIRPAAELGQAGARPSLLDLPPAAKPSARPRPADDARLGDSAMVPTIRPPAMPAGDADRSGRAAWMLVLVVGAICTGVVATSLVRATRARAQAHAHGPAASAGPALAGSSSASSSPPVPALVAVADMVLLAPGTFTMGAADDPNEGGPHAVRITKRFYVDRTEVTTGMYFACVDAGACMPNRVHVGDAVEVDRACNTPTERPRHPINCVDRAQAAAYCAYAGKRLPTEAEWEYAARGTDGRLYPWGNNAPTTCTMAAIAGLSGECRDRKGTSEVGGTPDGRSAAGLYDMAGNVWEWVADGHAPYGRSTEGGREREHERDDAELADPRVPDPSDGTGVLRGGSWDYSADAARSTYRNPSAANAATPSTGFRCVRNGD